MDIVGIGLANMDLVANVTDAFLTQHKIPKGLAKRVDELAFARLRSDLPSYDAMAGGCAANTICGMSAYGLETAFIGKIGNDSFESLYRASFTDYLVSYDMPPENTESSQCAVLVTPDGERSFAYMDGASWYLQAEDFSDDLLAAARMIYVEIYLFEFGPDNDCAKKVFSVASSKKIPLVMNITDHDYARRYAPKIRALAKSGILSLIIGNHTNLPALTETAQGADTLEALKGFGCDVLMTASDEGAYYITERGPRHFPVERIQNPQNTTGAGDQFAAGFLTGRLEGRTVEESMAAGASSARLILSHDGARPPLVNRHSIRF